MLRHPDRIQAFYPGIARQDPGKISGHHGLRTSAASEIKSVFTMIRSNCHTDLAEDHELATEKVDTALDVLSHFDGSIFRGDGCWADPSAALRAIRESIALLQSAEAIALRGLRAKSAGPDRDTIPASNEGARSLLPG
ncbi:hypothetical protein ACLN6N_00570 [Sphingomonas carotinifaciens]|uniref:hypothetical protein n=1 Tax=Sphingomonas carotinifaciens TaxID=1166323 RepID=UPI0039A1FB42